MAHGWKRLAEIALARGGAAHLAERRNRPSVLVLAYHNIIPRGENVVGDASLHIDQQTFADQLDFIAERHHIIPLTTAMQPTQAEPHHQSVVITFDDAYLGTMTAGIEELKKRRLPATIFIPPGLLGSSGFWWDALATSEEEGLLPQLRTHALESLRGRSDDILAWASEQGLSIQSLPEHARPIGEEALLTEHFPANITFGAHTWSHPNLAALEPQEVADEIGRSRNWLKDRCPNYVDWLTYPYGLHSPAVTAAAEARYDGALLITGGHSSRRGKATHPRPRTPRVHVPRGLSLDGLSLRLSGLLT